MSGREKHGKISKAFQNGVTVLVFLLLSVQLGLFIYKAVRMRRHSGPQEVFMAIRQQDTPDSSSQKGAKDDARAASSVKHPATKYRQPYQKPASKEDIVIKDNASAVVAAPEERSSQQDAVEYDGWKWDVVDLNSADSALLTTIPGIGPYYAKMILRYREQLFGSFAEPEQLMEIRGIDSSRFAGMRSRVRADSSSIRYIDLYSISLDSLSHHPYVGPVSAKGIDRFRKMIDDRNDLTLDTLVFLRVLTEKQAKRLGRYIR